MKHPNFPDTVCDITEQDFWSSMRAPSGEAGAVLRDAIAAGKAKKKARAYELLVQHHRVSLKARWEHQLKLAQDGPAVDPEQINDLQRNRIKGWHNTVVDFGKSIDWGTHAFGQSGMYGFHYLGWLAPASRAVTLSHSDKLRTWLIATVDGYYAARNSFDWLIPTLSPTYYELGSGAKSKVILNAYLALINTGDITATTAEAVNKLLLGFARSLMNLQKSGYRSGNWQINGCAALTTLACTFPEYREADKWRKRGMEMLRLHVKRDFFADGGHFERCWGYGTGCVSHLSEAYEAIERAGGDAADLRVLRNGIRKAYRWFAATIGPKGLMPAYGDDTLNFHPTFLERGRRFFPKSTDASLGVDRSASHYLKPSGYVIFRNGGGDEDVYGNMSVGRFMGWHSHNDLFNVNLAAFGIPLIEEQGRWEGYDNPLSNLFRAPTSHNVMTIDGQHYDTLDVENRQGRDIYWLSNDQVDVVSGWHQAYRGHHLEPQAVASRVYRTVVFVKAAGYMLVHDFARPEHMKQTNFVLASNWHAPFPFKVADDRTAVVKHGQVGCVVKFADAPHLRRLDAGVDFAGDEVATKLPFLERFNLRARRWMGIGNEGAVGFTTLLLPFKGKQPDVDVRSIKLDGGQPFSVEAFEVTTPLGKDVIVLNPEQHAGIKLAGKPVAGRGTVKLSRQRTAMDLV